MSSYGVWKNWIYLFQVPCSVEVKVNAGHKRGRESSGGAVRRGQKNTTLRGFQEDCEAVENRGVLALDFCLSFSSF